MKRSHQDRGQRWTCPQSCPSDTPSGTSPWGSSHTPTVLNTQTDGEYLDWFPLHSRCPGASWCRVFPKAFPKQSPPAKMKSCPGCLFLQRSDTKARTFWFIEHPYLEPASLGPVHHHWHAEGSIAGNALVRVKNTPVLCPPSPLSAGGWRVPGFVTCS